jgi:hypothetical protein
MAVKFIGPPPYPIASPIHEASDRNSFMLVNYCIAWAASNTLGMAVGS